jgi:hypothetical protein
MNKTKSHLHIFSKKNQFIIALNLHRPFIATELITCIFFIFWHSKIRVSPTDIVFSLFPPWCRLSSGRRRHSTASCHTFFPWSQDIFGQRFVPSPRHSSQNQSIESAPPPLATLLGQPDFHPPLL